jgi:(4S)-4-hydroxy-5-phosphonooxypentane-2,3-dione isomerase
MSVKPIHAFAKWTIKPGQLETVLTIVKDLHARSIEEKGNLFYNVLQDNSNPNILVLFEGYTDEAALTQHRNASYYIEAVVEKIRPLLAGREVILTTPLEV